MFAIAFLVVALVLLPALGVWAWSRFILTQVEGSLRSVRGFEPRHFEIGRQAAGQARRDR